MFDTLVPEYIQFQEQIIEKDGQKLIENRILITDVQISDVGYYTCTYKRYLHLLEDNHIQKSYNSIYLFVTGNWIYSLLNENSFIVFIFKLLDYENLFVKSMPIMMGIYGQNGEISCRLSSSKAIINLIEINEETGIERELNFTNQSSMVGTHSLETILTGNNNSIFNLNKFITYNPRRGFWLPNITNERFICRANLIRPENEYSTNMTQVSADNNIIIHYTS